MPLLTTSVPNLVQGVSQQPDNLRFPGQAEEQVNAFSSVVDGLTKRPHTDHIAALGTTLENDALVSFFDRDVANKHVMLFNHSGGTTSLNIFNTTNGAAVTTTITSAAQTYLNGATNPLSDFRVLNVADYTFVADTGKTVAMAGTTSTALPNEAVVFVKQGNDDTDYNVTINGNTATTSGPSDHSSETIASDLATDAATPISSLAGVTSATANGSVIKIVMSSDLNITVSDSLSNTGLGLVYKSVSAITDLPIKCFNGHRVKVKGDVELVQDDYYVKFETKDGATFGEGTWVEDVGYGVQTTLDNTTLPIQIVPTFKSYVSHGGSVYKALQAHTSSSGTEPGTGGGSTYWETVTDIKSAPAWSASSVGYVISSSSVVHYSAQESTFTNRLVGDDETNPNPSFVGKTINDIFFFKNRLGLLTDGSVIFSEADEYFNFFRTTVLTLLDGAPIDVGVAHTKVSTLKHAVPFQEKLVLFSPQSQFVLRGADLLTAKTVNISPITEYNVTSDVKPLALTNYVYFSFPRDSYEGLYEFYVDKDTDIFDASEITSQVPTYVPSSLRQLIGTPSEDVIVASTTDNLKHLYVYRYFWQNREKIQSAWMRFEFAKDIVGSGFIDSDLFVVTTDGHLEKMAMEAGHKDTGKNYAIHLDRRVASSSLTRSYSAANKKTTVSTMPYDPAGAVVYTADGLRLPLTTDAEDTSLSATEFTIEGDYSSTSFFVGLEYESLYTFSTQTLKQPTERGGRASSNFTHQVLRRGAVDYDATGHFTIEVTPQYRDTYSYAFNPSTLGADAVIGSLVLDSGSFRFPIQCKHDDVTIKIKSSSALPMKLLAAEFESFIHAQSKRYS
jgi:hypothetical protein